MLIGLIALERRRLDDWCCLLSGRLLLLRNDEVRRLLLLLLLLLLRSWRRRLTVALKLLSLRLWLVTRLAVEDLDLGRYPRLRSVGLRLRLRLLLARKDLAAAAVHWLHLRLRLLDLIHHWRLSRSSRWLLLV